MLLSPWLLCWLLTSSNKPIPKCSPKPASANKFWSWGRWLLAFCCPIPWLTQLFLIRDCLWTSTTLKLANHSRLSLELFWTWAWLFFNSWYSWLLLTKFWILWEVPPFLKEIFSFILSVPRFHLDDFLPLTTSSMLPLGMLEIFALVFSLVAVVPCWNSVLFPYARLLFWTITLWGVNTLSWFLVVKEVDGKLDWLELANFSLVALNACGISLLYSICLIPETSTNLLELVCNNFLKSILLLAAI